MLVKVNPISFVLVCYFLNVYFLINKLKDRLIIVENLLF